MRGVTFGNKHSYRAYGLVLKEYPIFTAPTVKKKLVEVPGSDVVLDLTESLTGKVQYGTRKGVFEFTVMGGRSRWPAVYTALLNDLHGKRMEITLDDDLNYYYTGRVEVSDWQSDKTTATIVLTAEVEPHKKQKHTGGVML